MKFACPSCGTRYSIANDKLPLGASVKCTCKVCGVAIRLNPKTEKPLPEPAKADQPDPSPRKRATLDRLPDMGATAVVSLDKLNELRRHAASDTRVGDLWYVVIDSVQHGPMNVDALRGLVDNRTIDLKSFVWKNGMTGWKRIEDVDALHGLLSSFSNETSRPWLKTDQDFNQTPARIDEASGPTPSEEHQVSDADATEDENPYRETSPGDDTLVFMATAGLLKRRRTNVAFAVVGIAVVVAVAGTIALKVMENYTADDMGASDELTTIEDPLTKRLFERVREEIAEESNPQRREALQRELLGLQDEPSDTGSRRRSSRKSVDDGSITEGIPETAKLSKPERTMVEGLFHDKTKETTPPNPETFARVQSSDLPDGLTREAISQVISDKQSSMKLCVTEAFRHGEKLNGRMDVQITIEATGEVSDASINTEKYKNSSIGQCTIRRVSSWKFPRFNGDRVTVEFPYVLTLNL